MSESTPATPPAAAPSAGPAAHHAKHRPVLVWVLIVLAALIGFVFTLSTWANRQLLDTNSWTHSSSKLLADQEVRSALSVYIVNQLYDNVDVEGQLAQRLPPQIAPLAGPIAAGLRQPAQQAAFQLLGRPRVQALWENTNRLAHERFVAVVENKTRPGVSTANGNVTLDVTQILDTLAQQVGLPAAAIAQIPPDAGKLTILKSDQLSWVQTGVRTIKAFSLWLIIIDFVLWGAAIYFAAGARRAAMRNIGWSLVVVGALLLVVRHSLGSYVVNAVTLPENRAAGERVWVILTGILAEIGWAAVFYGLVIVAAAILAGPTRVGTAIRSWIAPVLNHKPVIAWCVVALAYILLLAWGPTHALRVPIGILLFAVLIAAGVLLLRRETLAEFPEGAVPVGAGLATSAGAALKSHRPSFGSGRKDDDSVAAQIERLNGLKASGAISDEEYRQAKAKVLA